MTSRSPQPPVALVIEHDASRCSHTTTLLRDAGLDVRVVPDAAAAADALTDGRVEVVIALETGGLDLLESIRAHDTDLPVVFVPRWPLTFEPVAAEGSTDAEDDADALRGTAVTAAISYRLGRRRRQTMSPRREGAGTDR